MMDDLQIRAMLDEDPAVMGAAYARLGWGKIRRTTMALRRGYLPDGRGLMYAWRPVPPGETVRLDDSATLMFTKTLR
ncbi:hypothetical protein [Kribbella sp. NPDC023855]|uniref:hypothetical protein n=1 Tax=Kribbella sp. NPDC023855 TaxID=3154698 RepID=UPI0033D5DAF1